MTDPATVLGALATVVIVFLIVKRATQVSPKQARQLIEEDALILDVRSPGEFEADHLDGAVNTPLTSLSADIADLQVPASRPILAYCLSGSRSAMAVRTLKANGFKNTHNLGSLHRAKKITAPS